MPSEVKIEGFSFGPNKTQTPDVVFETDKKESSVVPEPEFKVEPESKVEPEPPIKEAINEQKIESNELADVPLKDEPLNTVIVKSIVGVSSLEPMVIYVEVEDGDRIGIPGFFDSLNETFMLMDVSPVPAQGFYDKFEEFIKNLKEQKEKKNE